MRDIIQWQVLLKKKNKDSFVIDGVLTKVDTFKAFMIPGAFTWDMRLGVEFNMGKGNMAYVNLRYFKCAKF